MRKGLATIDTRAASNLLDAAKINTERGGANRVDAKMAGRNYRERKPINNINSHGRLDFGPSFSNGSASGSATKTRPNTNNNFSKATASSKMKLHTARGAQSNL